MKEFIGFRGVQMFDRDEFPQWEAVQLRQANQSYHTDWGDIIVFNADQIENAPVYVINTINHRVNIFRYIPDPVSRDKWKAPYEFLKNLGGDCEDYAITKFYALMECGFNADQLEIVIVNTPRGLHAILAVECDDEIYILDNQRTTVVFEEGCLDYRPIYGLKLDCWYRYSQMEMNGG